MPLSEQLTHTDKPSISAEDALKNIQDLFKKVDKEKLAKLLADRGDTKKPNNWSSLTNAPYYRERFALELKVVLDEMIQEAEANIFEDREFFYSSFPTLSHNTLYLRVNQSKLYLVNKLDSENKYKRFLELVAITREKSGIRLSYNRDVLHPAVPLKANKVMPIEQQTITWKVKLDEFLSSDKAGVFELDKLALDDDDIEVITNSLSQLNNVIYSIKNDKIRIVRLTAEQAAQL